MSHPCPCFPSQRTLKIKSLSMTQDQECGYPPCLTGRQPRASGLCHFLLSVAVTTPAARVLQRCPCPALQLLMHHGNIVCKGPHNKYFRLYGPLVVSATWSSLCVVICLFQPFKHVKPTLSFDKSHKNRLCAGCGPRDVFADPQRNRRSY